MRKYYCVPDVCDETFYDIPLDMHNKDHTVTFEWCAEDYFYNHDGWESVWPILFTITNEVGDELISAKVSKKAVPEFYVRIV